MKLIETLYVNCKHNYTSHNNPQNSHVLRLDQRNEHAYGVFYTHVSNLYGMIENLQEEGILYNPWPYHISIIFNKIEKFSNDRKETNLDILKYFINNLLPPINGVIISIYEHPQEKIVRTHYWLSTIWPFKEKWKGTNNEVIAIQPPIFSSDHRNYPNINLIYDNIVNELNNLGVSTKEVGYFNSVQENIDILLESKLLITYTGCCYYLAAGLDIPTLTYGPNKWAITDNYENRKMANEHTYNDVLITHWGSPGHSINKIMHYDDKKGIHHKPQTYTVNIGKVETDRDYQILRETILCGSIK